MTDHSAEDAVRNNQQFIVKSKVRGFKS